MGYQEQSPIQNYSTIPSPLSKLSPTLQTMQKMQKYSMHLFHEEKKIIKTAQFSTPNFHETNKKEGNSCAANLSFREMEKTIIRNLPTESTSPGFGFFFLAQQGRTLVKTGPNYRDGLLLRLCLKRIRRCRGAPSGSALLLSFPVRIPQLLLSTIDWGNSYSTRSWHCY